MTEKAKELFSKDKIISYAIGAALGGGGGLGANMANESVLEQRVSSLEEEKEILFEAFGNCSTMKEAEMLLKATIVNGNQINKLEGKVEAYH